MLPPPADAAWRLPVDGTIAGRFRLGPDPFAAGQRRGIDLAARPGSPAVAPCAGRVTFAGRLPRGTAGVSIRCAALTATVLGLAKPAVRAGASVRAGARLGIVGTGGRVRLGARRTAQRRGYVDPLALIAIARAPRHAPPAGPVARRSRPVLPSPVPVAAVPVAAVPARAPAPPAVPPPAWIGAALLAVAVPGGALAGRSRRRRRARLAATAAG